MIWSNRWHASSQGSLRWRRAGNRPRIEARHSNRELSPSSTRREQAPADNPYDDDHAQRHDGEYERTDDGPLARITTTSSSRHRGLHIGRGLPAGSSAQHSQVVQSHWSALLPIKRVCPNIRGAGRTRPSRVPSPSVDRATLPIPPTRRHRLCLERRYHPWT